MPVRIARSSASVSRSSSSVRFGIPVRASCNAWWRIVCSDSDRSMARPITFATDSRNDSSSAVKTRLPEDRTASVPQARSARRITNPAAPYMPSPASDVGVKRLSVANSSITIDRPSASTTPVRVSGLALKRRPTWVAAWSPPTARTSASSWSSTSMMDDIGTSRTSATLSIAARSRSSKPPPPRARALSSLTAACCATRHCSSSRASRSEMASATSSANRARPAPAFAGIPPSFSEAIRRAPHTRWPTRIGTATRSVSVGSSGLRPLRGRRRAGLPVRYTADTACLPDRSMRVPTESDAWSTSECQPTTSP